MQYGWLSIWLAGLLSTLAMTAWLTIANSFGASKHHPGFFLGTWLFGVSRGAFAAGLGLHFAVGVLVAAIYAVALSISGVPAGVGVGLVLGALHWAAVMLGYGLVDRWHPAVRRGQIRPPGIFARREGWTESTTSLVAHLLYGAIAGGTLSLYGRMGLAVPYSAGTWKVPGADPSLAFVLGVVGVVVLFVVAVAVTVPLGGGDELGTSALDTTEDEQWRVLQEAARAESHQAEPGELEAALRREDAGGRASGR